MGSMTLRERLVALADDAEYDGTHKSVLALAAARIALEDAARRLDNIPYQRDAHPAELLRKLRDILEDK